MLRSTTMSIPSIAVLAVLSRAPVSWGFQASPPQRSSTHLRYSNWDAFENRDAMELMIGGSRYEMVELPDSMMSTTLWVGNLNEFTSDEMLSECFQQASSLKFVPACVARKPNYESLRYGFVTFRSEEEKETAMDLLHGHVLLGKVLKVEPIRDHAKYGRIRAPQKIVDYAVGPIKWRRNGEVNTMRRATAAASSAHSSDDEDDSSYRHGRDRRRTRMEKRKTRGRYKNQQRKNSRMTRMMP